jgi:long-chain acyl-CoA synthetase
VTFFKGSKNGYYQGNPLLLFDDMALLKPTFFVTVPRILSRIYSKITDDISKKSSMSKWFFNRAVGTKKENFEYNGELYHKLYDKLIFDKVKARFGGHIKAMICGSAPIAPDVLQFFKVALGINIFECFGQTETLGPASSTSLVETKGGHVGGVVCSLKCRTKDIVEMNYYSTDKEGCRGEL